MCRKNGLVEWSAHVNQMLNDPSYISKGHFALLITNCSQIKIIAASIEDTCSIVAALDHLNEGGEREQETAMKERFVIGRRV